MSCEEKAQLRQVYRAAVFKFAEAFRQLQGSIGTATTAEFARLQRISDEARVESEEARLSLEQHIATHGC